jgi:hypothetical protein
MKRSGAFVLLFLSFGLVWVSCLLLGSYYEQSTVASLSPILLTIKWFNPNEFDNKVAVSPQAFFVAHAVIFAAALWSLRVQLAAARRNVVKKLERMDALPSRPSDAAAATTAV